MKYTDYIINNPKLWVFVVHSQAIIQELESYWKAKCKPGKIPLRSTIDPIDIPHLLPFTFLMKILDNPRDFCWILAGEHIITIGRNVVGMHMSQLAHEIPALKNVFHDCNHATNQKKPIQNWVNFLSPQGFYKSLTYAILPLGVGDDTMPSMLLGAVVFQQKEALSVLDYNTSFKR